MAITKMVLAAPDEDTVQLLAPLGATVTVYETDRRTVTYLITYGNLTPRLTELPNIKRALKQKFGSRLLDMTPTRGGLFVRVSNFGVVK